MTYPRRLLPLALLASLSPALAACGEVTPAEPAPEPEPTPEPEPQPQPAAPVQVTVLSADGDGAPELDALALFVAPDGTLIKEVKVDARGQASAAMPQGGSVHALRVAAAGAGRTVTIQTVTGVAPGDELVIGQSRRVGVPSRTTTQMTGTFTAAGQGVRHGFFTECGTAAADALPFTLPLREACAGKRFKLLATAPVTATGLSFATTDVDHVAGGTFTVPNTWQPMRNLAVVANRTPPDLFSLGINRFVLLGAGASPAVAPTSVLINAPAAGTNAANLLFAPGVGTRALFEAFISTATPPSTQVLAVRTADLGTSLTLDLGELTVPWISSPPVPRASGATWTQRDEGTPDVRVVTWTGSFSAGGVLTTVRWEVADGATTAAFTLPGLPASQAAIDPTRQPAGAVTATSASVQYVDHSETTGYAQARRVAFDLGSSPRDSGLFTDRGYRVRTSAASSNDRR